MRLTRTKRRNSIWHLTLVSIWPIFLAAGSGAQAGEAKIIATYTLPEIAIKEFQNRKLPGTVTDDHKVLLGSVGSDLWHGPGDARDEFWMMTDRGPNGQIAVDGKNRRTFWIPDFNPTILRVRTRGSAVEVLDAIPILGQSGKPVSGLSNLKDIDEAPYNYAGKELLSYNPNGLDTEGLVRTRAGEFWIVEEYGPSIVHVGKDGRILKRYVPADSTLDGTDYPVARVLPAIYNKRKINRGFEGVALSPDEKLLYIVLQSPLSNPDRKTGDLSRNTRILVFDIAGEKPTNEYVYRFEISKQFDPNPKNTPDEMKLSGVVALDRNTLLVLERTDLVAKLYSVDLRPATNILKTKWDDLKTSPTLESLEDPASDGLRVLSKTLVVDLSALKGVPEKIEGIAVLGPSTIAIANDNDFDSEDSQYDDQGNNIGKGKKTHILTISLPKPLPLERRIAAPARPAN